jgi:hypothetical protein
MRRGLFAGVLLLAAVSGAEEKKALKVEPLPGPFASIDEFCRKETARREASAEFQKARESDLSWREPADREAARKDWGCSCDSTRSRSDGATRPVEPFRSVRHFTVRCRLGEGRSETQAALALQVGEKLFVAVSETVVYDRLAAAAGLGASRVEFRRIGALPGLLWRVTTTGNSTHGDETAENRSADLQIIAVGPSGTPSITEAMPLVDRRTMQIGRKRPRVFTDVAITADIDAAGEITLKGRTTGAVDQEPAQLTGRRAARFP